MDIGEDTLTVADVAAVARHPGNTAFALSGQAAEQMAASVDLRNRLIATGRPIYGVTTGFGDSARFHVGTGRAAALQHGLIRFHLNGSGPDTADDVVRATLLIRANCLARGRSGVRRDLVDLLLDLLRHDILPRVPERGSVGASGDLVPLCYVADVLTGHGEVTHRGAPLPAAEALDACGLTPVTLEAKEGLALINGTSFMSGFATLAAHDAEHLALVADVCTALTCEALEGNLGHFHDAVHRNKPHPGQLRSAARIRALLTGSRLATDHLRAHAGLPRIGAQQVVPLERAVQDRYSVRCAPHVTGVLLDTLGWVVPWLDVEINSSNDNPLFDPALDEPLSGGNFYGGHVGQAMDALKTAVASVGDLLDRQLALLVDDKFNRGLPLNLAAPPEESAGMGHGFKGAQIACSALAAEALKLTNPATAHSRSTEAHNQDKVSMGTIAARDARTVVELVTEIAALHLLACCQAAELRGPDRLAPGTRAVFDLVRTHAAFLDTDRRLDTDLRALTGLIRRGGVSEVVEGAR
ncbi:HAL/PAL/TAL family ammonia-lyase [Streptomyces sp. 4F14]|uniref:HAL/PAL/TAL family ammonia-lyase n=1 Tax=Streptomyces sp. 4F14 TaxID=3394380 RepID=UPI003A8B80C3